MNQNSRDEAHNLVRQLSHHQESTHMKTSWLSLFSLLFFLLPGIALASYGLGETKPVEVIKVPSSVELAGKTTFYQTELDPPAAADGVRFFIIWRGAECDSRINVALVRQEGKQIDMQMLASSTGGTPGYFNLIDEDTWGLTLVDYHAGTYNSLGFQVSEDGNLSLKFHLTTKIPLPEGVGLH